MNTRELYKETVDGLKELLQQTINNFSSAYDTAYNYYNSQPLFSVTSTSREQELLKQVDLYSEYQLRNALAQLCKQLAKEFGHKVADCTEASKVDFYEMRDGMKIGYYISMQEINMPDLTQAVAAGMTEHIVVVAKNNLINLSSNSHKYRTCAYKKLTHGITLEEYFNRICPGEFEVFLEYVKQFNYDAKIMLGLSVSPIPTQKAIQKKREKLMSEFDSFFFKNALPITFTSDKLDFLQERFHRSGIFQLDSASFIDSFISSEWYFDLLTSTDGMMEQTAIVAGYLKAIEQFLFNLMLSREDLEFTLIPQKAQKRGEYVVLTKDNKSSLLSMANNLLVSIDINYGTALDKVYVNKIIGYDVQKFLHDFFTHTRNGYFHKDNIYTYDEIKAIREQAYCAFLLLGSSFLFDLDELKSAIS